MTIHDTEPSPRPRRILLIRPSALGDVCRTVHVLSALKRSYPAAAIDWLVQDTFAAAVANHPDLNEVLAFPRSALARWTSPATWGPIRVFLQSLRDRSYDLVLDCQGLARSGVFAAATGAPRRVGLANAAELGWLGLTEGVDAPRELHAVERMSLVAAAAGAIPTNDLRLYSAEADREHAYKQFGLSPGSYILLAPMTRWPGKRWPGARFADLAVRLLQQLPPSQRIAFVGGAKEQDQCGELEALAKHDARVMSLVGKTSVGQLMAVVEGAGLVVACDSAALHMAVGFDRRLVGLFGPTDVRRVGPYGRERDVIQRVESSESLNHKDPALGAGLMSRISVDEVLEAVCQRLSATRST